MASRGLGLARALLPASLLLALVGCVVVPYKPPASVTENVAAAVEPGRLRVDLGPPEFLRRMSRGVLRANRQLQQVDGQAVLDAVSAPQELTVATLLQLSTRDALEPLDLDYLVLFGEPVSRTDSSKGGMTWYLGFVGALHETSTDFYWTSVIDARLQRVLAQDSSESHGSTTGIGAFYGLFVVGNSDASARQSAIGQVATRLAQAHPTGAARVAFLAVHPIPTTEELAALARLAERERVLQQPRWSALFPPFTAMPPPPPGQALVYVYRPSQGAEPPPSYIGFAADTASGAGRLTIIQPGGYHGIHVPAGELQLVAEPGMASMPKQTITLQAAEGQTYFIRATVTGHLLKANELRLTRADESEASSELQRCERMPSAREYDQETRRRADLGDPFAQVELGTLLRTGTHYADGGLLEPDLIEAYMWLEIPALLKNKYVGRQARRELGPLSAMMTPEQIALAHQRAEAWIAANP